MVSQASFSNIQGKDEYFSFIIYLNIAEKNWKINPVPWDKIQ